jgi:hypothetical protein
VFVELENIVFALKWQSLVAKSRKKSSFYKEKSFAGLTSPRLNIIAIFPTLWGLWEITI